MKITIKNRWELVTYFEYEQLVQIAAAEIPEQYKTTHLLSVLTNLSVDELENLLVTDYMKLVPMLSFLDTDVPKTTHKDSYMINGRKYYLQADVTQINAAQFIDYSNYLKEENVSLAKLASCFLIPKGHSYGDGYDINQVINDIGSMCVIDLKAIAFFLQTQYAALLIITADCLKKIKIPKKQKRMLTEIQTLYRNTASSLI